MWSNLSWFHLTVITGFWLGIVMLIFSGYETANLDLACPAFSTNRVIDLLQMHFGSRRAQQQTKAKHDHKVSKTVWASGGYDDLLLEAADESLILSFISVPRRSQRWTRGGIPRHCLVSLMLFWLRLSSERLNSSHSWPFVSCSVTDDSYLRQTTLTCVWLGHTKCCKCGRLSWFECHEMNDQCCIITAEWIIDD